MAILPVKFETLPEDIRAMLLSDEFVEKIELIGEKQSLPPMEQGFLVRICAKLVTGILQPANFVNTISDELDISREKAAFIAQEINRDIFSNIKESLKTLHFSEPATPNSTISSPLATQNTPMQENKQEQSLSPQATLSVMTPKVASSASITPTIPVSAPSIVTTPAPTEVDRSNTPQRETIQPHIGSIFEQKLGGEFRLKSDAVTYIKQQESADPVVPPTTATDL